MNDHDTDDLGRRIACAYDEVLGEPVPDRLTRLLHAAPVVDLAAARERRARATWGWAEWGGMAASLVLGAVLGVQFLPHGETLAVGADGAVTAGDALARALDTSLASEARGAVRVQLSFLDGAGRFCRTFTAGALAGLACHEGTQWSVVATAQAARAGADGMRQAASALPQPVLDAVDARIQGAALDATQERSARDRGWRR